MAEIIEFKPNKLGFDHAICGLCKENKWHIKVTENNEFYSIICSNCGNEVFCNLVPIRNKK